MRGQVKRTFWCATGLLCALVTSGCNNAFRSFGPIESPQVYLIPTSEVANQVRCELHEFLNSYKPKGHEFQLDDSKDADITLTLKTDSSAYVQYLGINLSKFGLNSLGQLVALNSNNTPSLGARLTPKSTVSAVVAMTVPQKLDNKDNAICAKYGEVGGRVIRKLSLKKWLTHFFNEAIHMNNIEMSTVKLTTSFTLVVDVSAGLNPFFGNTYLLPVSGESADINPSYMHQLEITLNVCKPLGKTHKCSKKQTKPAQPALTTKNITDAVYAALNKWHPIHH